MTFIVSLFNYYYFIFNFSSVDIVKFVLLLYGHFILSINIWYIICRGGARHGQPLTASRLERSSSLDSFAKNTYRHVILLNIFPCYIIVFNKGSYKLTEKIYNKIRQLASTECHAKVILPTSNFGLAQPLIICNVYFHQATSWISLYKN